MSEGQRMTEAEAIAALRAELAEAAAADRFSGAVLVARRGDPIFAGACGFADREEEIPNTVETRFRVGSIDKMFTAVATLQLVQAGELKLTDRLGALVRDYPDRDVASKVTVHQLLTHTSGVREISAEEFYEHRPRLRTLADYVDLCSGRGLAFEPGASWAYSNYGFLLLGVVIERVTGQSYYDRVRAAVFAPAGMASTASPPGPRAEPGRAVPYTRERPDAPWVSAADLMQHRGTPAGGGESTVTDLVRFATALVRHELLDAAHTALLTAGKADTPGGDRYAYGCAEGWYGGVRCVGHVGGGPGTNGQLILCETGYAIAVLANLDPPAAERPAAFVRDRLPAG